MLIVQKYGGTSVGSVERIQNVASRILETQAAGNQVVVVVSAMGGETDRLVALAEALNGTQYHRELDVLLATGEQASTALLSMAIRAKGGKARSLLAHQVKVSTDSAYSRARIREIDCAALKRALDNGEVPIVAGFQGVDPEGNITTLGRGGSDTSAVAVAASLKADRCDIYTDVRGVYTTDPNLCPNARLIPKVTFQEMMELAGLGAKVLQIRSVEIANNHNVPLYVRSSFSDDEGTMVVADEEWLEKVLVTGVSLDKNQARITIRNVPLKAGVQASIFKPIGAAAIVVDMIVQDPPTAGRSHLSFTVPQSNLKETLNLLGPTVASLEGTEVLSDSRVVKVSIVGAGMRSHSGVAQRMFELLGEEGIDILLISTSEIKVSCLVEDRYGELAVRVLHDGFSLGNGG